MYWCCKTQWKVLNTLFTVTLNALFIGTYLLCLAVHGVKVSAQRLLRVGTYGPSGLDQYSNDYDHDAHHGARTNLLQCTNACHIVGAPSYRTELLFCPLCMSLRMPCNIPKVRQYNMQTPIAWPLEKTARLNMINNDGNAAALQCRGWGAFSRENVKM